MHDTPSHSTDYVCQIWKKIHSKLNAVEPTAQVVRYLSSFIAKLQLNGPEGIGQG